jgi:hypothetical protein
MRRPTSTALQSIPPDMDGELPDSPCSQPRAGVEARQALLAR